MSLQNAVFYARGMHCTGCEHIIEESVRKLAGVQKVKADYPSETVSVVFDPAAASLESICAAVAQKGYRCTLPHEAGVSRNAFQKIATLALAIGGIALIILLDTKVITQGGVPDATQRMSYGLILALGLLTGFHCVGMCGGFVLSYTADDARLGRRSHLSHLLYGLGKTLSYTGIGALFGLLGAIVTFTPFLRGTAGMMAGAFLIVFGLNMLNLFPPLRRIRFGFPKLGRFLGQKTHRYSRPLFVGMLNGLNIACGPLQAMYVMAAGTGSAAEGAKMLFTFGIGTLPVLLSFGVLMTIISGELTHQLLKASGAIVIILGAVMINRGLILTGSGHDLQSILRSFSKPRASLESLPPS
ncbi:MAG TPA: sulfite exporter TauE/SafE family protein, partial [Methylocella sp.]|nr:sulfite exporter TauE/SafE family protein [Methylocella sp.]